MTEKIRKIKMLTLEDLEKSKNNKLLGEFMMYCFEHPGQRFWQALRNWSKASKIYIEKFEKEVDDYILEDTFYKE